MEIRNLVVSDRNLDSWVAEQRTRSFHFSQHRRQNMKSGRSALSGNRVHRDSANSATDSAILKAVFLPFSLVIIGIVFYLRS